MQIINKKAKLNYQILETFEAGIELTGAEVKSIRGGKVSLDGAHVQVGTFAGTAPEARLVGMHTSAYLPAGAGQIDPTRTRKLLLHREEIRRLAEKALAQRLTLVPLRLYSKRGWIKVEVALARGKKKWEKRDAIKRRDITRELARLSKRQ